MSFINQHLPALIILLPLLAAPICLLLRRGWLVAMPVCVLLLLLTILLLMRVMDAGVISYELGGWEPPFGIEYRIDAANALVALLIGLISAVVMIFAKRSVESELSTDRYSLFYSLWLLCITGLLGICITGDAFNVFVFLEISSLSGYGLIALGKGRGASLAALRYLIMGTLGGTFLLIGIGFLYAATGTLNMADITARLPQAANQRTVIAAMAFCFTGIGIKLAAFPLHQWLPEAYARAPSAITAWMASTATKVAAYALMRFVFTIMAAGGVAAAAVTQIGVPLAVGGMLIGSAIAIYQTELKKLLAWSSVAQIGYILLGIALASEAGLRAALLHMLNHGLIKGALFLALGCMIYRLCKEGGEIKLSQLAGISKRMPWTTAAFVAGGLSLIGVPLTAGFISKWALLEAALAANAAWLVVAILISSLMAVIYIWKIVEVAYFAEPAEDSATVTEAPASMLIPAWLLIAGNLYLGINSTFASDVAQRGAEALLAGVGT